MKLVFIVLLAFITNCQTSNARDSRLRFRREKHYRGLTKPADEEYPDHSNSEGELQVVAAYI